MKRTLLLVMLALLLCLSLALFSCGKKGDDKNPSDGSGTVTPTPDPTLKNFSGITFDSLTTTYNGEEQKIEISGTLPDGATVSYSANKATDAGTYAASATVTCEGYNPLKLNATLTINKAPITVTVELPSASFEYDAKPHSLAIVGNIPAGTTVSYTYNGEALTEVTEVGKYTVVATVSGKNYLPLTLEATLTISSTEKLLYAINHNGVIYFQNDLDGAKLYKVDSTGKLSKVNNDSPEYFFSTGKDLYYYSSSLFSKVIKRIDSEGNVSDVCSVKGEYITTDGKYIYYAVNNLLIGTDENGIYRIDPNETTPIAERISKNKAAYLCIEGGMLYYSNLTDGKKLYSLNLNTLDTKCIHEEKVEYLIADSGILYFDSTKTASAITKYVISTGKVSKMTTDSGKYLTKVGDYIYYVNNDLLTSTLFGDGIYKVSISTTGSLPGTKVLSEDGNGYSSLTSDGKYLYYYKLNDKHFYRYDPITDTEIDLMATFTPPLEKLTLSGEANVGAYKGEIYYTNPEDGLLYGACLYKYNPTTGTRVKVLADNVAVFWFHNDYLYYSTCILTNYALYRMDMTTGLIEKINSDRCDSLIFEGDDIYYLKVDLLSKNKIMKMSESDIFAEPVVIYDDRNISLNGIYKEGNAFYFVMNPAVGYQKVYKLILGESKATDLGSKAFFVVPSGDKLFFYDDGDNAIKSCNLDGSKVSTVVPNVEVNDLYLYDGKLYYSSFSMNVGVYCYDISSSKNVKISDKVGEGFVMVDGKLWFLQTAVTYVADYPAHTGNGTGKLTCYDGKEVTTK